MTIRAASYLATASAKWAAAIRERKGHGLICSRLRSLRGTLPPAEGLDVVYFLSRRQFPLIFFGHREFERLVRREVHELRDVAVHGQDLGLPLVDHRDPDLVGHRVDDRTLLSVEQPDDLESGLRFAVFPRLRHLNADDPARFVVDDDVSVDFQLSNLGLFPRHRISPAAMRPAP